MESFLTQYFLYITFTALSLLFAGSRNIHKIGKKKTLEKKAIRARDNRFNNNNDNIDDSLVLKEVLPYTNRVYNK
jgi:hypothetical protein